MKTGKNWPWVPFLGSSTENFTRGFSSVFQFKSSYIYIYIYIYNFTGVQASGVIIVYFIYIVI